MAQFWTFCEPYSLTVVLCAGGAALVVPILAFVARHCEVDASHRFIPRLLQRILIVGGILGAILLTSDHCPFPGGLFHEGRPIFLGGWMVAAGVAISYFILPSVFMLTFTSNRMVPRVMGGQGKTDRLLSPNAGRNFGILLVLAAIPLVWLIPFETRFGLLLFPIAIHVLRTTLLPWPGAICFLVVTTVYIALIYLVRKRDDVLVAYMYVFLIIPWTVHGIANSRSFPDARIRYNKNLPPAQALAIAPTFRHASDRIILEEAVRQSKNTNDLKGLLHTLAEWAGNQRDNAGLPALLAVIGISREIEEEGDRGDVLRTIVSIGQELGGQEGLAVLQSVIASAKEIENAGHRSDTLQACSKAALRLGQEDVSRECQRVALLSQVATTKGRVSLQAVAAAAGKLGGQEGLDALQAVIARAEVLRNQDDRIGVLHTCAEAAQELDQPALTLKCLADAVVCAKGTEDKYSRGWRLLYCADAAQRLDHRALALECLADAVTTAKQTDHEYRRSSSLRDCALSARRLEQQDLALGCLADAVATANEIEDAAFRSDALRACRKTAKKLGIFLRDIGLR